MIPVAGVVRRYSNLAPRGETFAKVAALAAAHPEPIEVEAIQPERPARPKRWTAEAKAEVIALYEGGMSMEAIQRETGYNSMRVRRVLDQAGTAVRPNRCVLTPDVMAEVMRLKAEGIPNTELAHRYGVTHQAIARAVARRRSLST